jgi:extracellular factor (EF) 3-hydroxypalmitic acid methyl ester biosynthesis protein
MAKPNLTLIKSSGTSVQEPQPQLKKQLPTFEEALDRALPYFQQGNATQGIDIVFKALWKAKQVTDPKIWNQENRKAYLTHPIFKHLLEEPFTRHAFNRPRGYAGDAELFDLLYYFDKHQSKISADGKNLMTFITQNDAAQAIRFRRQYIADKIDEIAKIKVRPEILSVACGHLREVELSQAVKANKIGRFFAFDQDPKSLEVIKKEYSKYKIEGLLVRAREMLDSTDGIGKFDLIYANTLFDCLPKETVEKLTACFFNLLKPGGTIVVSNFLSSTPECAYFEMIMNWWLVYRSANEIKEFDRLVDPKSVGSKIVFDSLQRIGFLELTRK